MSTDLSESQEDALLNQEVQMSFDLTATDLTLHDAVSSDTELKSTAPMATSTEVINTPPTLQKEMSAVDRVSMSLVDSVMQGAVGIFRKKYTTSTNRCEERRGDGNEVTTADERSVY